MITYIDQLKASCRERGLDFENFAAANGVNQSTLWRWKVGKSHCHEATAFALYEKIRKIRKVTVQ